MKGISSLSAPLSRYIILRLYDKDNPMFSTLIGSLFPSAITCKS